MTNTDPTPACPGFPEPHIHTDYESELLNKGAAHIGLGSFRFGPPGSSDFDYVDPNTGEMPNAR